MANRYGEAALKATQQVPAGDIDPVARWESAMEKLISHERGGSEEGLSAWGVSAGPKIPDVPK